jgi:hypothetical protein
MMSNRAFIDALREFLGLCPLSDVVRPAGSDWDTWRSGEQSPFEKPQRTPRGTSTSR